MIKQVLVMRSDLKCRRGKENAQCSHAAMMFLTEQLKQQIIQRRESASAAVFTDPSTYSVQLDHHMVWWLLNGFKKVGCRVRSEEELMAVYEAARASGLPVALVEDEGLTEFAGKLTKTCIAVGPAHENLIDPITGHLELY